MQIPAEYVSEKNYEGTRLIEITDEKVMELNKQLKALKIEANPFLEKLEKITPIMDPIYKAIGEQRNLMKPFEEKIAELKAELEPTLALYKIEEANLQAIDQKAQLIKNKMQPLVNGIVKPELGEFEIAVQMVEHDDGKIYVEVRDEVEEKIKQVRAMKSK